MDEEQTSSYKEPCPQCSEVNWGISDECKYYCKSCHTVIEKTKDIEDDFVILNTRIQSISRGLRKKKAEWGWDWYICEGFQLILIKQAEALEALGICPDIKDNVMCNLWRRYLQKTKQAYCKRPISQQPMRVVVESSLASSELDSESDFCSTQATSESDMEAPSVSSAGIASSEEHADTSGAESAISSVQSGSIDGGSYLKTKSLKIRLSMPMTLAFCYLSLLWVRASITLSDLLRLVFYRHIPYYNPQQYFPEKMKLYGPDINVFEIQNFPTHDKILKISQELAALLALPPFPPITESCYYHPNVLCMKYLMELNLPDELHNWTCCVVAKAKLDDATVLSYKSGSRSKKERMIPYDVLAVAIIVVVLKLMFALDDDLEWQLAKNAERKNQEGNGSTIFDFQKWHMTMRLCMNEEHRKLEEEKARFSWESDRIMAYSREARARFLKRKRMANNLQNRFGRLAGAAPDAGNRGPSSFLFNWEEQNTGKICFHGHSLEGIAQKNKKQSCSQKKNYWLNILKKCRSRFCKHWKQYDESQFPSSYRFVISLFSTVLRVEPSAIHYEVGLVEEKLLHEMPSKSKQRKKIRKKYV
ncbi:TATA box-binding protein-associated factor RNA polymerase I subunit B isoform X2 [Hyla sarda]|uniref:TATA box-binding protein-associated factor RNA polymerase I subunit B isoform X2 n=1 Tax=Hyla sarda TaxID=327740 RepID=UPI0024C331B8|nr:TATA box-binding protein-associated factor RNA polymerase I subunit B isoform X2 [Hyla sarda]